VKLVCDATIFVKDVRQGSIIADLIPYWPAVIGVAGIVGAAEAANALPSSWNDTASAWAEPRFLQPHPPRGNRPRHHIAGPCLASYAPEMAWREDRRRVSNGEQFLSATSASLTHSVSRQWAGYWRRRA